MIDQETALNGLILGQTALAGALDPAADQVLVYDSSAAGLRRALVQALPSGVTSVALTATPATVFGVSGSPITTSGTLALSLDSQGPNKVLAGPVSGAATTPAFRLLTPSDLPVATVAVGALLIDWSLGNCFSKALPASGAIGPMTFSNPSEGQTITLLISQGGTATITFPTGTGGVYWAGGTVYAVTSGVGRHDILIFRYIGGHYYGNYYLNFLSI